MIQRRYNVWVSSDKTTKEVRGYFVTDMTKEERSREEAYQKQLSSNSEKAKYRQQEHIRPRVATFPVSQLYDKDQQEHRAQMLCDYLNKIQEARERAERDTAFIDILTAGKNLNNP